MSRRRTSTLPPTSAGSYAGLITALAALARAVAARRGGRKAA